jgi:hypothetical protein
MEFLKIPCISKEQDIFLCNHHNKCWFSNIVWYQVHIQIFQCVPKISLYFSFHLGSRWSLCVTSRFCDSSVFFTLKRISHQYNLQDRTLKTQANSQTVRPRAEFWHWIFWLFGLLLSVFVSVPEGDYLKCHRQDLSHNLWEICKMKMQELFLKRKGKTVG